MKRDLLQRRGAESDGGNEQLVAPKSKKLKCKG